MERRNLTLWLAPRATLRHFAINAGRATARGTAVVARHPATLFVAIPLLALYSSLKYTGARVARLLGSHAAVRLGGQAAAGDVALHDGAQQQALY